jgi:hypothetical protein
MELCTDYFCSIIMFLSFIYIGACIYALFILIALYYFLVQIHHNLPIILLLGICIAFYFGLLFLVLGLELGAYTLSHSTSQSDCVLTQPNSLM